MNLSPVWNLLANLATGRKLAFYTVLLLAGTLAFQMITELLRGRRIKFLGAQANDTNSAIPHSQILALVANLSRDSKIHIRYWYVVLLDGTCSTDVSSSAISLEAGDSEGLYCFFRDRDVQTNEIYKVVFTDARAKNYVRYTYKGQPKNRFAVWFLLYLDWAVKIMQK